MTEESAFARIGPAPDPGRGRAVLAILRDSENRLILHLRDARPEVTHPGVWSFFGGGVEAAETLAQAMVRELEEETGLRVGLGDMAPFAWIQSDSPRRTRLFFFTATLNIAPAAITLGEGAGFGFFTAAQARALPMPNVLKPVLEAYLVRQA